MQVVRENEFDYRNAKEILEELEPKLLKEIYDILDNKNFKLNLKKTGGERQLSKPIQDEFVKRGWEKEVQPKALSDLRYDLMKNNIPIEIEIGHERLVYADFFKFLADYSKEQIPCGIIVVTNNPRDFGHTWHNSVASTRKKLEAVSEQYLVPILVIPIKP